MGLVIIPLVFEIIFVSVLTTLLHQTEEVAIREKHAKFVIAKCNGIHDLIFDAGTSLAGYSLTRNEELRGKYIDIIKTVMQDLRTIEILVVNDKSHREPFFHVQESCSSGLEMLENYRRSSTQSGKSGLSLSVAEMRGSVQMTLDKIFTSIQELSKEERKVSDVAPMIQSSLRSQIFMALTGGIVFNICLAIVLVLALNKQIVSRINVVIANTKRTVSRTELLPRVDGTDEISQLDSRFHDMADQLERVTKHKQELISMVSHDLRSPLMSVQVSLELIQSGALGELSARMDKEATVASRNVKRLIELINDLLDIEKIEAGRLEMHVARQELLPIIESAIDSVGSSAERKGIFIQRPLFDVMIDCDKQRIVQVLVNLLSNAIKFSPQNGEIGIEFEDDANKVKVKVRDDGPGIDEIARAKIFERFQQGENPKDKDETDRAKKGTGLGLAICKAIVAGHDGQIGVDSELGKGSVFWFTLPHRKG
jgi:signal transduction histidine kinase